MTAMPKILFADIETSPSKYWAWRPGEQILRHGQMVKGSTPGIICISYMWADETRAHSIDWGYEEQDTGKLIAEFDEIVKESDVFIGKNSDRFDVKHINAQRWMAGLPAFPDWASCKDDVEKQLRKHFNLPSYSLDYVSKILGLGGKNKMEFDDWVDIVEKDPERGLIAFHKMKDYCNKDVEDTAAVWRSIESHVTPKFNMSVFLQDKEVCPQCGSKNSAKRGTRMNTTVKKQVHHCNDCGRNFTTSLNRTSFV